MTATAAAPKTRRWLASAIATAATCDVALPFQRGTRRRPAAFAKAPAPQPRPQALAAR
ncbi:MAG TPA: hypothetical protein VLA78_09180 [Paracoccaceae bacterium]|nr:hypothetical protein [Paracoccaceae bacterium]